MPTHRAPRTGVAWGVPETVSRRSSVLVVLAVVATFTSYLTFAAFARSGLVVGHPWVLTVLFVAAIVLAADVGRRPVSRAQHGHHLVRSARPPRFGWRLSTVLVLCTALAWVGGWSLLLPAMAGLVAVVHVETGGHEMWRPAVGAMVVLTGVGQALVAAEVLPTVLPELSAHLAAAWILLMAAVTTAYVGHTVAQREGLERGQLIAEGRLAALMDSSRDVVLVADADLDVTYASPATTGLGHAPEDLRGTCVLDLVDDDHCPPVRDALVRLTEAGPGARDSIDVLVVLPGQERRWYQWTVQNLLDDPLVCGLVINQRDISERLLHQAALAHAAAHDPLTGLPNRTELLRSLRRALAEAGPGAGVGLLFVDLDGFKAVNDEHGHLVGDELLVAVAQRLRGALRQGAEVARLGGDEFCVLVTEVQDADELRAVADRLHAALEPPVAVSGRTIRVGGSIGIASTRDPDTEPSDLLRLADQDMYLAKRRRTQP